MAAHGGRAAASSVFRNGADPRYQIAHLNDGAHGDGHAWIPADDDPAPWMQIELAGPSLIDTLIFGRDDWSTGHLPDHQTPNRNGRSDRPMDQFSVQVSDDGRAWRPIHDNPACQGLQAGENAVIRLSEPARARCVRLAFQPNTACVDEWEIYGVMSEQ